MKASSLANYIISCVSISAILSLISYIFLTQTTKIIPAEIYTLCASLAGSAVAAGLLARNLDQDLVIPKTYLNYILMGLGATLTILVMNYHWLIWTDKLVPKDLVPFIVIFTNTVLLLTNFRNSRTQKSNANPESLEVLATTFLVSGSEILQSPQNLDTSEGTENK